MRATGEVRTTGRSGRLPAARPRRGDSLDANVGKAAALFLREYEKRTSQPRERSERQRSERARRSPQSLRAKRRPNRPAAAAVPPSRRVAAILPSRWARAGRQSPARPSSRTSAAPRSSKTPSEIASAKSSSSFQCQFPSGSTTMSSAQSVVSKNKPFNLSGALQIHIPTGEVPIEIPVQLHRVRVAWPHESEHVRPFPNPIERGRICHPHLQIAAVDCALQKLPLIARLAVDAEPAVPLANVAVGERPAHVRAVDASVEDDVAGLHVRTLNGHLRKTRHPRLARVPRDAHASSRKTVARAGQNEQRKPPLTRGFSWCEPTIVRTSRCTR